VPDHDVEALLKGYAAGFEQATRPAPPASVRRRGRRLRARRLTVLAVAAAVLLGVTLLVADLPQVGRDATPAVRPPHPGPTAPPPPVQRKPGAPPPMPGTYVGYDADTERIVLVETTTGRISRWLTPSKRRTGDFVVAGDHQTVYLGEWGGADVDCVQAVDWKAVSIRTGEATGSGPLSSAMFALSRDGGTLVQVGNRRGGGACRRELVVRDTRTGVQRTWPMPDGMLLLALTVSDDGRRVAWLSTNDDDSLYGPADMPDVGVFDVERDRSVRQPMPPDVEHARCYRTAPVFDPVGALLAVIDSCEGEKPALLEIDPVTGREVARVPLDLKLDPNPFGGDGFVSSLSIDATGLHVLISGSGGEVAVLSDGKVRQLPGRYLDPTW
jgi:hypothetical protein